MAKELDGHGICLHPPRLDLPVIDTNGAGDALGSASARAVAHRF